MIELFGAEVAPHRPHGLLSVSIDIPFTFWINFPVFQLEHDAHSGQDGACMTLLVTFRAPLEEVPIIGKCVWHEVSKEIGEKLLMRIAHKNSTFPVHVIR